MKRYVVKRAQAYVKPVAEWYDDEPMILRDLTVYDRGSAMIETGILDANGDPIMVLDEMDTIGYVRHQ